MAKSNNIGLFDVQEKFGLDPSGELVDSSFELRYQYNYFIQDEVDVAASESALIGAQGQQFDISPEANPNSRPPVFITTGDAGQTNPRNKPRYFEIKLQGIPDADRLVSLVSYDSNSRLEFKSAEGSYNLSAATTPEQIGVQRDRIISRDYSTSKLNFENSFSVGLVDYNQQLLIDPLKNQTQIPIGNAGVFARVSRSGISRDLYENLKTELTTPIECSISVRQEAAAISLQVNSLTPDPGVAAGIIRSLESSALTPRAAIQEAFGRTANLDSVNDGIVNTFERSQDIELVGFEQAVPLIRWSLSPPPHTYTSLCLGYLIERADLGPATQSPIQTIVNPPSAPSEFLPLIPASTAPITVIDTSVRHGREYRYSVRRVYYIEQKTPTAPSYYGYFVTSAPIANKTNGVIASSVTSRLSLTPPGSLNFYRKGSDLFVDCGYPVTDERVPITKFLLFSRRSPADPFKLIDAKTYFTPTSAAQGQFNLGLRKFAGEVTVPASQVTLFKIADYDFQRGEMLAAACVDAHGNISDYSAQFIVREAHPGSRNLRIECASGPRAPLGFPNLFLKQGYGGFSTGVNGSVDIINSVIGASEIISMEVIPTYGLASSNDPASGVEWKSGGKSIQKAGSQHIMPATIGTSTAPNKITVNVLSITQETAVNLDILLPDASI